jgi:Kef-type K+ transport system membrane component KefB
VAVWFCPAFFMLGTQGSINPAVVMLIIFGSAKLLEELFERLGQPGIMGQILAGVLIGPSVLGWISASEFTDTMAALGVMFLLFRVGLEVDSSELMELGGTAFAVGALGVAIPFVSGWAFYLLWGRSQLEALFVGSALTATSVGITAHVLAAKGLLHRTASKIILGAAVVDDILALLLLGVITSFAQGRVDALELGLTSALAVCFILLVARWGRRTMAHVIARLEGRIRAAEAEFAIAMVLLFGLAALSVQIGVAAIIGAFLAGMALAGAVPQRVHDLTEGVTKLMVPFFMVNIGLQFRLSGLQERAMLIEVALLVPIAVVSKMLGGGLGALRFGREIATRVGMGMIPRGEFCMVVAQTGLGLKAISQNTYDTIVIMAVAAAAVTPPLLKRAFRKVISTPLESGHAVP